MTLHHGRYVGPQLASALLVLIAGCGGGSTGPDVHFQDFPPGTLIVESESLTTVAPNTCRVALVLRNTRNVNIPFVTIEYQAFDAAGTMVGEATLNTGLGPSETAQRQVAFVPARPCSSIRRFERTTTSACCVAT